MTATRRVLQTVLLGALVISDRPATATGSSDPLHDLHAAIEQAFVRFASLEETPRRTGDGRAVLPARWRYREEGSPESEVGIAFTLAPEGGAWYIREIRDLK